MAMAAYPKFEVLPAPTLPGELIALGPTDGQGIFIGLFQDAAIRYLDLSVGGGGRWAAAATFDGRALGEFGVHFRSAAGEGEGAGGAHVSFLESPKSWVCLRVPEPRPGGKEGKSKTATVVGRAKLPADVVAAACGRPGDDVAAVVSKNGVLTFLGADSGKVLEQFKRLESAKFAEGNTALAHCGRRRVAMVHQSSAGVQFLVLELNEQDVCDVISQGSISLIDSIAGARLRSVEAVSLGRHGDSLVLCWDKPGGKKASSASQSFTLVETDSGKENPDVAPINMKGSETQLAWWASVRGYLVEFRRGSKSSSALRLVLRDAKYGVCVCEGDLPLPKADSEARIFGATAGGVTMLASGGSVAAVRWSLAPFSLQMLVGRAPTAPRVEADEPLRPLIKALASGKRQLSADPALEDLFGAKRRKATDGLLKAELRGRRIAPSGPLVELVLGKKCLRAACAMLELEELDEDGAVQLLAAWPGLLARVVRRKHTPQLLDAALRSHLTVKQLTEVVETLLTWIEAYREYPEEDVRRAAPGLPTLDASARFLTAVADGCLPLLVRLDRSVVERAIETLGMYKRDANGADRLHASVHAAVCARKPLRAANGSSGIEVALLPL